jgi:predicted  nucleic acid-binding Zn-ribbon protein
MALHFTSVTFREEPDFIPTNTELENIKRKIDQHAPEINKTNKKNKKDPYEHLFRKIKDTDEYDNLGRNITEQKWRQNKIPWTKVVYNKKFY